MATQRGFPGVVPPSRVTLARRSSKGSRRVVGLEVGEVVDVGFVVVGTVVGLAVPAVIMRRARLLSSLT